MEACATAHYWGREALGSGHEVRLIPPIYVKPFVKRQKNDAADAEAIVEAALRPTMRLNGIVSPVSFSVRVKRRLVAVSGIGRVIQRPSVCLSLLSIHVPPEERPGLRGRQVFQEQRALRLILRV